ncbi:cysteine peptidase family C39 domain-containing protein [Leptolyngbya ohadii]|uniref:cysteine peptidase family C39 domain-containing protein n=1 Tax=Leptolyngbya ohadii TaxID=1962290 RepID=UPI000B5A0B7A|nr:cysteine peptidase family C39 domain-containing protein [Leptolyngbya ohadii]
MEQAVTVLLSGLGFLGGVRMGRVLLRRGATADNLFQGRNWLSLTFLGVYVGLLVLVSYLSHVQALPIEWRVSGMQFTWTAMRVILVGFCGLAFVVTWRTARLQVVVVALLGLLGLMAFHSSERYFLAPIYAGLEDNLQPNGIFRQTSDSSCAPAALASVLRRLNIDATESSVARLAGTSQLGTSMPQLVGALQQMNLDGMELKPTWEQMRQINRPGVLATWLELKRGRAPHAVGLLAMDDTTATIADPDRGKILRLSRADFERIWRKQYLPIFRPGDTTLAPADAARYLMQLGYLTASNSVSPDAIETATRNFQAKMGLQPTGKLDPQTVLLLSGSFLRDVPTLDRAIVTFPAIGLQQTADSMGRIRWID